MVATLQKLWRKPCFPIVPFISLAVLACFHSENFCSSIYVHQRRFCSAEKAVTDCYTGHSQLKFSSSFEGIERYTVRRKSCKAILLIEFVISIHQKVQRKCIVPFITLTALYNIYLQCICINKYAALLHVLSPKK